MALLDRPLGLAALSEGGRSATYLPSMLWYLALVVAILGAPVGLARLLDFMWTGHYHKVLIPLIVVTASISLLIRGTRAILLDSLGLCLLAMLFFGIAVGLFHGGGPRYFIAHAGMAIFSLLLYQSSRITIWDERWLDKFWKRFSDVLLIVYSSVIGLFWIINYFFGLSLYLGIGTGDLLFPMAYYLVSRKYIRATLTFLIILLSGKRGSLLACMVVMLYTAPILGRRNLLLRTATVSVLASFVILGGILLMPWLMSAHLPDAISSIAGKWQLIDVFSDSFDPDLALAGRNQELILAFEVFIKEAHHWFVGLGFGWSYFFDAIIQGSDTTDFISHYVHLSPANYVLLYGVPLTLAILLLKWRVISNGYRVAARHLDTPILRVMVLYWIGASVSSLSGYTYATDPLYWLTLGAIASVVRQRKCAHLKQRYKQSLAA